VGSRYLSRHELVMMFKKGTTPHANNIEPCNYGRYRNNIWDYAGINIFHKNRVSVW
jgi:hypothetical protein